MSTELFSSLRMQTGECGICYSDDPADLEKLGPIVNHLVNKHPGFHAGCLDVSLLIQKICPVCREALNPESLPLKKKRIQHITSKEIVQNNLMIQAAIISVFLAVLGAGVYSETFDLYNGFVALAAVMQICLIGFVGRVLFQTIQEQRDEVHQAILDLQ